MPVERDYPRAVIGLVVDVEKEDEPVEVLVVPRRVSVTRRPHTHADTCDVELDGTDIPFDPRAVRSVVVKVWMGNAASQYDDAWRTDEALRFLGYADTLDGEQEEDDTISFKVRDLSAQARDTKPLPTSAVPTYADTLGSAIRRVLDATPGGAALELDLVDGDLPLGPLVSAAARTGPIHLENDMTAWAVIEYVAGLANRIVNVDIGVVRVQPTRNVYAQEADQEPHVELVFNRETANTTKLATEKKFMRNRKGIRVVAWDPFRRERIEEDYPADEQLPPTGRASATRRGRRTPPKPPERDVFPIQGVTTRAGAQEVAKGLWQQRSRQEMSVVVESPYFNDQFLSTVNGDRVRVQLNRVLAAGLNLRKPKRALVSEVMRRLVVSRRAAEVLVDAALHPGADLFYAHEVTLRWAPEGEIGVRFELINLIAVGVEGAR